MFFRRGVSETEDWLQVKLWLFGVGAVLALLGMVLQNDWIIGAAGLVLAGGIALRFIPRRSESPPPEA